MKKLVSLLLFLLLLSATAGFAAADDPITVTFWHTRGSGANYDVVAHSVQTFNETIGAEKGIVVEELFIGNYDEILPKTQLAIQAGEGPQIVVMGNTYVGYLYEDGLLADMMPLAEASGFDVENILAPFRDTVGNTDGELHSLPYIRSTPMLYYNKTMADEKGLTPSNNLNGGLQEFAKGLYEVDESNGEVLVYGLEILNDFGYFQAANLQQLGSAMIAEDGKSSPALEDGAMLKVLGDWREWVDEGWCRTFDATNASATLQELFFQGKIGTFFMSSGSLKNILTNMETAGYEVGLLPYPTYGEPLAEIGGGNLCLIGEGNTDEQIEAAWAFLEFLMGDAMQANNAIGSGYLPVTYSVAEYEEMVSFWDENPLYRVAYDQLETAVCQEVPHVSYMQDFVRACWDAVSMLIQDQSVDAEGAVQMIRDTTEWMFQ